jgi:short-subunit dehydrogenase
MSGFIEKYGPWALVTGGARGIGLAFCEALAERGCDLFIVDILPAELETSAAKLRAKGARVETIVVDLAAPDFVAKIEAAVRGREVGMLVCSAAQFPSGRFLDAEPAVHARAVAVNALSPLLLTHALAKPMRARGRGGIILLSSMAALQGTGWVATYAATKAFDLVLAESLWWELKGEGVDVLGVMPGATDTEGFRMHSPNVDDPAALGRPADVAREALDSIGRAASLVCGEQNRAVAEALRTLPREQGIEMMSSATRRMAEKPKR